MKSKNQTTVSQTAQQVIYQPSGDPIIKLADFSGDSWSGQSGQIFSM